MAVENELTGKALKASFKTHGTALTIFSDRYPECVCRNGVASCELQAHPAPFSEIEYLRTKVRTYIEGASVATVVCPWQGDEQVVDIFSDGEVIYQIPGRGTYRGFWSSGFVEDDGVIQGMYVVGSGRRFFKLIIQPDSARVRGADPSTNAEGCFWIQ